ncbi:MAG: S-layer homology domain-containing protein, partial [Chloroflexi bacterium]|nr:S-layer homology domain-containing protein [Chloroflexota bacterium]
CSWSPPLYCPESTTTHAQMAIFLLKSKHGSAYTPPAVGNSTGFNDVPITHWAAAWIKQLGIEGISSGCGGGYYCPESNVTRAQMAGLLVRTFNLP